MLRLVVEGDSIRQAAFEAEGCAISRAAASALVDILPSWELPQLAARTLQYERRLGLVSEETTPVETETDDGLGDLAAFAGVREFPTRRRCAALPFRALEEALGG